MAPRSSEQTHDETDGSKLLRGATFMPDDGASKFDALMRLVSTNRYTTFFAVYMELMRLAPQTCADTGFSDAVLEVMGTSSEHRMELVNDPAFLIWLNLTMGVTNRMITGEKDDKKLLAKKLLEFGEIRERFDARMKNEGILRVPGTRILVQRFNIDPLIAATTPPSYDFPADKAKQKELENRGYSLLFFQDLVKTALERIKETWPEEHEQFVRLTKVLGYLPDANFRSCSASRYTGVIYLAARDNSILDVEESLVHEGGHQLVYNIVECAPLTREDTPEDEMYTLPWSGQRRDFYGYFHAFYIYILLAKYFARIRGRPREEQKRATERMVFILRGLVRALPDFESNKNFTVEGRELFANLKKEIRELETRHEHLLKTASAKTVSSVE